MFVASACPILPSESSPAEPNAALSAPGEGDLPQGALIEISGPEARVQAAHLLAQNRHLPAAWIEQNLEALPEEVLRTKMDFKKVLFINGRRDSTWAASSLISSGQFPVLVYYAPYENEKLLRRLRRQAQKSGTSVLLLRDEPCFSLAIRVHLRAQNGRVEVLRWRKQ